MPPTDALQLQQALLRLYDRVQKDHRLAAELLRAQREFFGGDGEVRGLRLQRFLEWFLLERESLALAAVPAEVLPLEADEEALLDSSVGVFRIEGIDAGTAMARDLQDDRAIEIAAPAGSLLAGDLAVGRLYASDRGSWLPSAAIAVYRPGAAIGAAFQHDLARLDLDRRLTQAELEGLLLRQQTGAVDREPESDAAAAIAASAPAPTQPIEHLEAELEAVFAAGGAAGLATEVSEALAAADRPGAVMGPLLDQLAFDTEVDLDRARRAMLELWNAHHQPQAGNSPVRPPANLEQSDLPPGATLGERLVRALDRGLDQKQDLGELFRQLEAMAGIEPDPEDDDEMANAEALLAEVSGEQADDDDDERSADANGDDAAPGDLAPLVTEFAWETGCEGSATHKALTLWVDLQGNAALPHVDVETVTAQDLMRLLLHVYLGAEPTGRAAAVRAAFAAVREFSQWCETTQELSLATALAGCEQGLLQNVDRLQRLGEVLSGPADRTARAPGLLRVEDVGADGFGVRGDDGSVWLDASKEQVAQLQPGDLLLGAVRQQGRRASLAGLVVALPGDAEALIG